jgi:hypothetical protein
VGPEAALFALTVVSLTGPTATAAAGTTSCRSLPTPAAAGGFLLPRGSAAARGSRSPRGSRPLLRTRMPQPPKKQQEEVEVVEAVT